jgi:murein L,D-transpeptidase YcbB/YkuD
VYEGALADALRNFQRRHGRAPSGKIDRQTLADLNVPLTRRVQQMQLTLERWRWLPADYHAPLIVANIPEFQLRAYNQDLSVGLAMKVVVGKAYGHKTPVFSSTMSEIVFRPYWQVPQSIVQAEMIPLLRKDPDYLPAYLAIGNFELTDSQGAVVETGKDAGKAVDQLQAGKLLIRQRPGPYNALGLVKFVFSNSYNVYLHDTPVVGSFAESRRDFTHGCIRLEKPANLAAWVLRGNPGWTMDRIRAAMDEPVSQRVHLAHPIPVAILYGTVVVLEDGVVHFYEDIYGHDALLQRTLAKGYPYPK